MGLDAPELQLQAAGLLTTHTGPGTDFFTRWLRDIAQLPAIIANVGYLMGNDQMVFVVDSGLHVVANRPGASALDWWRRLLRSIAACRGNLIARQALLRWI